MRTPAAVLLLALLLIGCDATTDPPERAPQGLGPPIATGLFLTDEDGMSLGEWGRPTEGGLRTYPNPSLGSFVIRFDMPRSGRVRCWVVAALAPDEATGPRTTQVAGGSVLVGGAAPVAILLDETVSAGWHELVWNTGGIGSGGRPTPTGFYRIFLQTEDALLFNDHFGQGGEDFWLPVGLEHLMP